MTRGRLIRAVGSLVALLGGGFVVRLLVRAWPDVQASVRMAEPTLLVAAVALALPAFLGIGTGWWVLLRWMGHPRAMTPVLCWYYLGQLGKYVPGGVWNVVGRGELARRGGIPGTTAYLSTVYSLAATYASATVVVLLVQPWGLPSGASPWWRVLAPLTLVVGLLLLHPRAVGWLFDMWGQKLVRAGDVPRVPFRAVTALVVGLVPSWLAIGLATYLVVRALGADDASVANILLATACSWVAGFVVVGAPGGLGVREAVFVATATSIGSAGVAAAAALLARVLFVIVDAVSALVAAVLQTRRGVPVST